MNKQFIKPAKYKEAFPAETNKKLLRILDEIGIEYRIQETLSGSQNLYSYYVEYYYNGAMICHSNGKSSSKEYALSSALAEFMERLAGNYYGKNTSINLFATKKFRDYTLKNFGFESHCNVKFLTKEEIVKDNKFYDIYSKGHNNYLDIAMDFNAKITDKMITHPLRSLHNEICYVPVYPKGLNDLTGSNGLCAGNSKEEALNEGFSELVERHSQHLVVENENTNFSLPEFPLDFFDDFANIKRYIADFQAHDLDVHIYQASFDLGLPVILLVVLDKQSGKFISNFGAFPVFHIAVERCFTEVMQNTHFDVIKSRLTDMFPISSVREKDKNDASAPLAGYATYNENILLNTQQNFNYDLSAFIMDKEETLTNKDIFEYWAKLEKKCHFTFWYADMSYLGFNVYHTFIPEVFQPLSGFYCFNDMNFFHNGFIKEKEPLEFQKYFHNAENHKLDIHKFLDYYEYRENSHYFKECYHQYLLSTHLAPKEVNEAQIDNILQIVYYFIKGDYWKITEEEDRSLKFSNNVRLNDIFYAIYLYSEIQMNFKNLNKNDIIKLIKSATTNLTVKEIEKLINKDYDFISTELLDLSFYIDYEKAEKLDSLIYRLVEYEAQHHLCEGVN